MQFNDLGRQYKRIEPELEARIKKVFEHGKFINGPEVGEVEEKLAKFVGVKYGVAVGSGTDALTISLMAIGTSRGDYVFTSAFSFVAAAEAIKLIGAKPVFVDIDPETLNIDPDDLGAKIKSMPDQSRVKAVIPVNLFGVPCDYHRLNKIAVNYDIVVVEDLAQSFGAEYGGVKSGNLGHVGCTSFFPSKPLGCYGDGGMIFTNEGMIESLSRSIARHGAREKYDHIRLGMNSRLDSIQAAVLLEKINYFYDELEMRRQAYHRYKNKLEEFGEDLRMQRIPHGGYPAYAQLTVICRDSLVRSEITAELKKRKIPYQVYYPKTIPDMRGYRSGISCRSGDRRVYYEICPVARDACNRVLSLPFSPYITIEEINQVADAIRGSG